MYQYNNADHQLVAERVEQFSSQVQRRLNNELSEDEFKPLRLMNGLYLQLHAYMLRVAIPYGTLSSDQLRKLAVIAKRYDRGYGHFTTRQNIQFNWLELEDVPNVLAELTGVEMHAIQTSGNCIRNVTADPLAGVAADEIEDARVFAEIVRQWSTLHPEFSFLPRKFKIAVSAAENDRALLRSHDIALRLHHNDAGEAGFEVMAGGGQGRTPVLATTLREFLPQAGLLSYLEAVLRVYNQLGRRDNLYKARIKILVMEMGGPAFAAKVEEEWARIKDGALFLPEADIARIKADFAPPIYEGLDDTDPALVADLAKNQGFARWVRSNIDNHKQPGYGIATISLKSPNGIPGDVTAEQMEIIASIADQFSFGEIRVTQKQNLVLPNVRKRDLYAVWLKLDKMDLATANAGLLTDIVACPGLDFCNLANARSIPLAQRLSSRFRDLEEQHDIGKITLNISGCINACAQHHTANIGILGVDKKGTEHYQITLGGRADGGDAIGTIVGPAFPAEEVDGAVDIIISVYLNLRQDGETFIATVDRLGLEPFKGELYALA
jgi:sulfite reductase (NADPH) hemoprotein beta-component